MTHEAVLGLLASLNLLRVHLTVSLAHSECQCQHDLILSTTSLARDQ